MQRNRAGDESKLEVTFPVWTHKELLWVWVYLDDAVYKEGGKREGLI